MVVHRGIPERLRITGLIDTRIPARPQTTFQAHFGGGLNSSNVAQSFINGLDFSTDSALTTTATLSAARGHPGSGHSSNASSAFFCGGGGSAVVDVVAKATSTRATPAGAQSPVGLNRNSAAGQVNGTHIYGVQGSGGWRGTPVGDLLPVDLSTPGQVDAPVAMRPTQKGLEHYLLRLDDDDQANADIWGRLNDPQNRTLLNGMTQIGSPKPGATVLARDRDPLSGPPLLCRPSLRHPSPEGLRASLVSWRHRQPPPP